MAQNLRGDCVRPWRRPPRARAPVRALARLAWRDSPSGRRSATNCSPTHLVEVLFKRPFLQPPSILPISSSSSESSEYLSVVISLRSQAIWTKNFKLSILEIFYTRDIIFFSGV